MRVLGGVPAGAAGATGDQSIDNPGGEAPLGLRASRRIVEFRIGEKLVELVPEALGLSVVTGSQATPNPAAELSGNLVSPCRMPEYDRIFRPSLRFGSILPNSRRRPLSHPSFKPSRSASYRRLFRLST